MNIGFIGLGKLGLPCALAIESKGYKIVGYDIDEKVKNIIKTKILPYKEIRAAGLLKSSKIEFQSVKNVVENSEIIFVAIQTPHIERYEGITRIPDKRVDFDYSYLREGIRKLSEEIEKQGNDKIVVIISTVLPGTIRREVKPLLCNNIKLCYNPFFIAMGTTIDDFLNPEFVLFGMDNENAANVVMGFYKTLHNKEFIKMSIESAELTKVAYNTFITMKITVINALMEICHKIEGANIDDVTYALKRGTDRILSPKYMNGGMADGGGCHPRDNIALSWLARDLNLSHDIYNDLMITREDQTDWLADLIIDNKCDLPVVILGKSFKPETNLTVGSPSILLKNLLEERGIKVDMYDPIIDEEREFKKASLFFIGTKHDVFKDWIFPEGSIIIDPFRYIDEKMKYKVIQIGKGK